MSILDECCQKNNIIGAVLEPYSCVLNQTSIKYNANKFYIMQIIQTSSSYVLVTRYGRIGEYGTPIFQSYTDQSNATCEFSKKFKAKTGNNFGHSFVKKEGKYFLTEIETPKMDLKDEPTDIPNDNSEKNLDDEMDDRLKFFIEFISNEKMLSDSLLKLNVNPKKMPLGKISNTQLDRAVELLQKLKKIIESNQQINIDEINSISSEYYTLVPYSCGRRKPPVIDSSEKVDNNIELIEELRNIQITYTLIKNSTININRLTNIYSQLNVKLKPLDSSVPMYSELVKYVNNTQCQTHSCKLKIVDIYELNKESEYDKYTQHMGNKMLLFHGSPVSNWCSIIKNGLYLDPSKLGVRISGKMFGYGIYWANAISKSFNYCNADCFGNKAVLAIAEVALGDMYEQYQSNIDISQVYLDNLKKNSTWGKGQSSPENVCVIDGVIIPNGIIKKNKINACQLQYDEFIIYNTNQYKIRYVIVVENTYQ